MARYIDADALIEKYERVIKDPWNKNSAPTSWASAWEEGIADINDMPTADVVPRSEVDLYRKQVDELEDELASTYDKLENAKAEIERLQAEKDALIKNYAECMKDYASEIFAEVNMQIFPYSTDIYIKGEELIIIPKSDYNDILTRLKKKYMEARNERI